MARKEKSYERMLKEGYGQGRGEDYKPWGTFRFASKGQTGRPSRGLHFDREYLFFSRLEQRAFHLLDFRDDVLEIREQFPLLPREETYLISNELGIRHPQNVDGEIYPRSVDLLVNYKDGKEVAYQVKYSWDITDRVVEKFMIECEYFRKRGIDFKLITEKQVDGIKADNIENLKSNYKLTDLEVFSSMASEEINHYVAELYMRVIDNSRRLCDITNKFDSDLDFPEGTGLAIFRHLIILKILVIDLSSDLFSADKVIKIISARDLY